MSAPLELSTTTPELAKALCDIPSESGEESAIADAIENALGALSHLELHRDGDAIVAATRLNRARRVIIAGHIDTVPIRGNVPSHFENRDGEQWLVGRGSVDMKAGAAVQLKLAAELIAPAVDVTWVFYDNEEVASERNGLNRIMRNSPELLDGDFAVLCEPTAAQIEGGCNGTCRFLIRTHGVRAHSARSWVGVNAIHAMTPVLALLASYEAASIEVDGLVYREGLNAVRIVGGVAGNVIPDECTMEVNFRFAPSRSEDEARAYIEELFGQWDVEFVDMAGGARPGLTEPLAQGFIAATGGTAQAKYGWTDVARFAALGVPAVNYGPGDPLKAHADDEAAPVAQILACEAGLRAWLTAH